MIFLYVLTSTLIFAFLNTVLNTTASIVDNCLSEQDLLLQNGRKKKAKREYVFFKNHVIYCGTGSCLSPLGG